MLKPGFFKNEFLLELPFEYRLLFAGLWCLADRDGRMEDRPKRIKMELFPADDVDVETGLSDLAKLGFIERYEREGKKCLQIVEFKRHQRPHRFEKSWGLPEKDRTSTVKVGASTEKDRTRTEKDRPSTAGNLELGNGNLVMGNGIPKIKIKNSGGAACVSDPGTKRERKPRAPATKPKVTALSTIPPVWKPATPTRTTSLVGRHLKCLGSCASACAVGLCVPAFLVEREWLPQAQHDESFVTQFVNTTLQQNPGAKGDALKFWRHHWNAAHSKLPHDRPTAVESNLRGLRDDLNAFERAAQASGQQGRKRL